MGWKGKIMCNHYWGTGERMWQNPLFGEYEQVPYRYCYTCGIAEKWINAKWELAPEWFDKLKGVVWGMKW